MGKFIITPTGHCSVFLRRQPAQQSIGFDSEVLPASPSASSRGGGFPSPKSSPSAGNSRILQGEPAAWSSVALSPRCDYVGKRGPAGSSIFLQPLETRRQPHSSRGGGRRGAPKLPTEPGEGLQPWEKTELQYVKDLQQSTFSSSFGSGLVDQYWRKGGPAAAAAASGGHFLSVELQRPPMAEAVKDWMSASLYTSPAAEDSSPLSGMGFFSPKSASAKLSVLEAAMAMPWPETPNTAMTPRSGMSSREPSKALSARESSKALSAHAGGNGVLSPWARTTPLTLPGMKAVAPERADDAKPGSPRRGVKDDAVHSSYAMQGDKLVSDYSFPGTPRSELAQGWSPWKMVSTCPHDGNFASPFHKFLDKPRNELGLRGVAEQEEVTKKTGGPAERARDDGRMFGYSQHHESHEQEDQSPDTMTTMHAKSAGMIGGLSNWLNSGKGVQGQASGRIVEDQGDKDQFRGLIVLAKKYHLPVNEVRDVRIEFNDFDSDNLGHISLEEFISLIRKRTNLPEEEEIPFHLLKGVSQAGQERRRIGFEEFLKWSILTAWTEEMMMPSRDEREIRQLAREQDMNLPDVEKVKRLFDEFDTDGSGEIEEEEFRHILYKMLHVKRASDVPLKRLQRYWREVDLDGGGSIGFNEFLIWFKSSFAKDGKVNL